MGYWLQLRSLMIVGPILGLLMLGLYIALRSGVGSLRTHQDLERLAVNFSSLVLRVVGYIAGILAVQRYIGYPLW